MKTKTMLLALCLSLPAQAGVIEDRFISMGQLRGNDPWRQVLQAQADGSASRAERELILIWKDVMEQCDSRASTCRYSPRVRSAHWGALTAVAARRLEAKGLQGFGPVLECGIKTLEKGSGECLSSLR